jgi:tetratricopeptide (TPR) repeat protein
MERSLAESIRINPYNRDTQSALARLLIETRRYDDAIAHYQRLFDYVEPDAGMLVNMGLLSRHKVQLEDAIAHFERALKIDADYPPAHLHLAETLAARGRSAEAVTHYEQYLELISPNAGEVIVDPRHALEVSLRLASAYAEAGRLEKAIALFERCASLAEQAGDTEMLVYALSRLEQLRGTAAAITHP